MLIDIRDYTKEPTHIKFSDAEGYYSANTLTHTKDNPTQKVWIDDEDDNNQVVIETEEDAKNLIRALTLAIEKKWWS